jgi:hypothetical protein
VLLKKIKRICEILFLSLTGRACQPDPRCPFACNREAAQPHSAATAPFLSPIHAPTLPACPVSVPPRCDSRPGVPRQLRPTKRLLATATSPAVRHVFWCPLLQSRAPARRVSPLRHTNWPPLRCTLLPREDKAQGTKQPPPWVTSPHSYLLPVRPSYRALFSRWPPAPTECADRSDRTAPFRPPLFASQMLTYMKGAPRHLSTSSPPLSTLVSHRAARLPCSRLHRR